MTAGSDAHDSPTPGPPGSRKAAWLLLAAVTAVAVVFGARATWRANSAPDVAELPQIDLENCTPRVAQAIRRRQQSVREAPGEGAAWGQLGMVLLAHQFDSQSQVCFARAEVLDPDDVRWPYLHGLSLTASDREAAIQSFRRALQIRGDLGVIHSRLAELFMEAGQYDKAEEHLQAARQLRPDEIRPLVGLARLSLLSDRLFEAERWAQQAAQIEPDRRLIHELLAGVYQRQGRHDAAVRELEIAAALPEGPLGWNDPLAEEAHALRQDAGRYLAQAEALLSRQQTADAVGLLQLALLEDPRDPKLHCALGRALLQDGQPEQAARVLDHALRLHPASAEVRFQRGVVFYFGGDYVQAERLFREAIAAKPDYAPAHYNLGHTLEHLGNSQAALDSFQAAARYRPAHAGAHTNAARILLQLGRTAEARRHLHASVRLAPDDPEARRLLDEASLERPGPPDDSNGPDR